jgi:hypothetical protein
MKIRHVLLFIWQLPQHIAAGILYLFIRKNIKARGIYLNGGGIGAHVYEHGKNWGVSLGEYIFIKNVVNPNILKHEFGHSKQSFCFGPFYLIIIGIPSVLRNIWDRIAHRKWDTVDRAYWYYLGYPEKQADRLGKVKRNFYEGAE